MAEANKQTTPKASKPDRALKRLDVLVGKWITEWRVKDGKKENPFQLIGTDTYEWLPGGFFLVHKVDVRMEDGPYQVTEMIGGYDAKSKTYPMRSFDSQGNFQLMQASVNADGVWTFAGETIRATLEVGDDGNRLKAHWEQRSDGSKWQPWMDMRFTKIR